MKKSVLITGSTDGIGKRTAVLLAQAGYTVYLHGRNPQKLQQAILDVEKESGQTEIRGFQADLSDFSAVRKLGATIQQELPHLDVLINNAGVFNGPSKNTDGLDLRIVVNYLAPIILTQEVLPLLRKASMGRIINLSSAAQDPLEQTVLLGEKTISERQAYGQSKLALTAWSFRLAQQESGLVVIPVNPGSLLNTKMVQEAFGQFWASADKGAQILFDLAVDAKYANASGKYFDNDRGSFGPAHPAASN
ncbi:MAG: SDR family NAD(P)-dependent oxidoreductase, partial [Bacteroidota bacterium]